MLRITAYADRLLQDLDALEWTDSLKTIQRNWIGRSEGADIRFTAPTASGATAEVVVYTTRPDTLFGATCLVLAPEHPLVDELTAPAWPPGTPRAWQDPASTGAGPAASPAEAVDAYRRRAAALSDRQRQAQRARTAVFTGSLRDQPRIRRAGARSSSPTTSWPATAAAPSWPCPPTTSATSSSPGPSGCRSGRSCGPTGDGWRTTRARCRPAETWSEASLRRGRRAINSDGGQLTAGRPRQGGGDRPDHPLARGVRQRPAAGVLPASRLAVLTPAVLGRAVPDRVRRDGPADRASRVAAAGRAAADVGLRALRRPRAAEPRPPLSRAPGFEQATLDLGDGPRPIAARPTSCPSGPGPAGTTCATWTRPTTSDSSTRRSSGSGWATPARSGPAGRPLHRRRRACGPAPAVRPVLAQGAVRPGLRVDPEPFQRLYNQGYILADAFTDPAGRVRAGGRGHRRRGRRLEPQRPARDPSRRQDGQEPQEHRLARCHLRGVRRGHPAPVRDGDGPPGPGPRLAAGRHRGRVPLPAAALAQRRSTRRPAWRGSSEVGLAGDEPLYRLLHQTIDAVGSQLRRAARTTSPSPGSPSSTTPSPGACATGRRPPRRRRTAGADGGATGAAHRRRALGAARARWPARRCRLPTARPRSAGGSSMVLPVTVDGRRRGEIRVDRAAARRRYAGRRWRSGRSRGWSTRTGWPG